MFLIKFDRKIIIKRAKLTEEIDEYICSHIKRICREKCSEKSLSKEDFNKCVERCVDELKNRCEKRNC